MYCNRSFLWIFWKNISWKLQNKKFRKIHPLARKRPSSLPWPKRGPRHSPGRKEALVTPLAEKRPSSDCIQINRKRSANKFKAKKISCATSLSNQVLEIIGCLDAITMSPWSNGPAVLIALLVKYSSRSNGPDIFHFLWPYRDELARN